MARKKRNSKAERLRDKIYTRILEVVQAAIMEEMEHSNIAPFNHETGGIWMQETADAVLWIAAMVGSQMIPGTAPPHLDSFNWELAHRTERFYRALGLCMGETLKEEAVRAGVPIKD